MTVASYIYRNRVEDDVVLKVQFSADSVVSKRTTSLEQCQNNPEFNLFINKTILKHVHRILVR